jgi:alpha-tubulin suppressor-like RCC1 family protein
MGGMPRTLGQLAAILLVILAGATLLARPAAAQRRRRTSTSQPAEPPREAPPPSSSGPHATTAAHVAVGGDHSCASMSDGRVLCWGNDVILTLLAPRTSILGPRLTPTPLARTRDAQELYVHGSQPLVRIAGDRLISGGTWDVQGLGTVVNSPEDWRTDALELSGVAPVRLVPSASGQTLCAIHPDGVLRCRGDNQFGQLGAGSSEVATERWLEVTGLAPVVSASHGGQTGCAITRDGALSCFGRGLHGVLGDGASAELTGTPVRVATLTRASAVAVSREGHACAIDGEGAVHCWGQGRYGELGDGTLTDAPTPRRVALPARATRIAVGRYASCALAEGHAYCWGAGNEGQLGDGRRAGSSTPVEVRSLDRLTELALGDAHACALRDDGTIWCWGRNTEGSCGVAPGTDTSVPVQVPFTP